MDEALKGMFTVATAIIGVAIIATLVSRNANTAGVLQAAGGALATGITAAVSPVNGGGGFGTGSFGGFSGGAGSGVLQNY
jgi:hypothetical protein